MSEHTACPAPHDRLSTSTSASPSTFTGLTHEAFKDLADVLNEGIVLLDAEHLILAHNNAAEKMLAVEIVNGTAFDTLIHQLGSSTEALGILRPGNSVVVVVNGALIEGKLSTLTNGHRVLLLSDRSEELRWQSQLAEQGHMLSSHNEAYMVIDRSGVIRYANRFCEEERCYKAGTLVGVHLCDMEIGRDADGTNNTFYTREEISAKLEACLKSGELMRYEAWHLRSDGEVFPTDVSIRPYRLSSETVLLLRARDETARYRYVQDLMDARAVAESSNRAKSAFMAVTSHELRTPLTTIIGFIELLQLDNGEQDTAYNADLAHSLSVMHAASHSLQRLIEDVLDFAKIEGQTLRLHIRPVDIQVFIESIASAWTMKCSQKSLQFSYTCDDDVAGNIATDPDRLRQLLDNLINNAYKFTAKGTITLHVSLRAAEYCFTVSDTGCGIDTEHAQLIFDPFYQIGSEMTHSAEGTGLGLSICRNLSRLLGGSVQLLTSNSAGSTFELRIPVRTDV